ncbi:MAG: MarR family winged helix-turn-helix transcriptional regulator [Pseudomonadota bacterium]
MVDGWAQSDKADDTDAETTDLIEGRLDPRFMEEYVLYMMALASHHMSEEFHGIVRQQGLRVPEWRILATLASYEPQSVKQLGGKTLYDQPRLTKTIAKMEKAGLLARHSYNRDRRVVMVRLTEAGRETVRTLIDLARQHERKALGALTETERGQLKRLLRKLI